MLRFLFPSALFIWSCAAMAQQNPGDTLEKLYWPNTTTINRIQILDSSGLIRCTYYCQDGTLCTIGWLKNNSRPYSDRKTGIWIDIDTSGKIIRREKYVKGEEVYRNFFSEQNGNQLHDSGVSIGNGRYEIYKFRNGVLYYYEKSRRPWLVNGFRTLKYKIGLADNYNHESWTIVSISNDSNGVLKSKSSYYRDNIRRTTTVNDTSVVRIKYNLHSDQLSYKVTDTLGHLRDKAIFRRHFLTGYNNYPHVKKRLMYDETGQLNCKRRDGKIRRKVIFYHTNGKRHKKSINSVFREKQNSWNEFGQRDMVMKDFHWLFFDHYTRKSWSEFSRKKSVTHKRPSRFHGW